MAVGKKQRPAGRVMIFLCGLASVVILAVLISILGYILARGLPGLTLDFFLKTPQPVGLAGGGMAHAVAGSLILVGLACLLGITWGVAIGVYLAEYGGRTFGWLVRFSADVLNGIPSIIVGIFVYSVMVVKMGHFSALAGGAVLGVIMVPTVARNTEEMLRMVPGELKDAALALGIPFWKVVAFVMLPTVARGIGVGIVLAVARVAGETAPLFFTALNNDFWPAGLNEPIASLPMEIFRYAISPFKVWHELAWTGALVLVTIVLVFMVLARILLYGQRPKEW
ncbi:MAG: phosphate ABC transporter permease PstA [Peptococcaceae bacterium]|nr:MAG: phosphate ABC transporter permease PstA [Peptococcaceae bacterium]